ncbi:hypothetical protein AK812_SmicGene26727 [Symbiodinium microadriaticum]|uniref:Uncharacterized protein n=1 Tax=Symbiodinium microadriaticum TaxID=2951 RepID=A0A1Q9D8N9_SYMMI|nr:hypothetical protein AK812_SmicGene26727 [Symbiodinium microadriaticum]
MDLSRSLRPLPQAEGLCRRTLLPQRVPQLRSPASLGFLAAGCWPLAATQRLRRSFGLRAFSSRMALPAVPPLRDSGILKKHGISLTAIEPLGARVRGLDLKGPEPTPEVRLFLEEEMARRGFLVFEDQGVLTGDEQVRASEFWGGREIHSTHGVHPQDLLRSAVHDMLH